MPRAVIGDVTRLRQILLNLLANAVKLTEAGEVALIVSLGAVDPLTLQFSVSGSGIGLGAEVACESLGVVVFKGKTVGVEVFGLLE